jgi:hypothetical protein
MDVYINTLILQRKANIADSKNYEGILLNSQSQLSEVTASIADAERELAEERTLRTQREEQQRLLSTVLELPSRQRTLRELEELEADIRRLAEEETRLSGLESVHRKTLMMLSHVAEAAVAGLGRADEQRLNATIVDDDEEDVDEPIEEEVDEEKEGKEDDNALRMGDDADSSPGASPDAVSESVTNNEGKDAQGMTDE